MKRAPNAFALALALTLPAGAALAEDLKGVVRVVGSAINQKVLLTSAGASDGPAICRDEVAKRIGRLSGMTVQASGDWSLSKTGEKTCFEAKSFTVSTLPNGRDAVVGTLTEKDGAYQVAGDDGKMRSLVDVPDGLKKLAGKKVVLDLKVIESPASGQVPAKVVTYSELP